MFQNYAVLFVWSTYFSCKVLLTSNESSFSRIWLIKRFGKPMNETC